MATGKLIFDIAMSLADNVGDDTREYSIRAVHIINQLAGELYPYSDTFTSTDDGTRPVIARIQSLSDTLALDDYCCHTVLPYGLAAQLMATEDPNLASFLQQRYEELRALIARGFPQEFETITDAYTDSLTASGAWE